MREQLFNKDKLTLNDAVDIYRAHELAKTQIKTVNQQIINKGDAVKYNKMEIRGSRIISFQRNQAILAMINKSYLFVEAMELVMG